MRRPKIRTQKNVSKRNKIHHLLLYVLNSKTNRVTCLLKRQY